MSGFWMPARMTRPKDVRLSSSQIDARIASTTPSITRRYFENSSGPSSTPPFSADGSVCDSGAAPQIIRIVCSATIASPKVTSRLRIGSSR